MRQSINKQLFFAFLLCSVLLFSFSGCTLAIGGVNASAGLNEATEDKVNIIATIFAPYDFAREIAGDKADITMLLPPAAESHSYEPTPQDIIKIQKSDVFIYVGGESDSWVRKVLDTLDTSGISIITLMDCVDVVEEEIVEGMYFDSHEQEQESGEYDEHVWTSPLNSKLIVQKISDTLCNVDEANADYYRQSTNMYLEKLDELDAAFRSVINTAKRKTIVFGDRFPFRYFADTYGLDYFAAFPGCSAESEPGSATIAFLIDKLKDENIPVVFHAELSNKKIAETISEATGAKVLLLHACHGISKEDFINGVSYMELMTRNVDALKEALY